MYTDETRNIEAPGEHVVTIQNCVIYIYVKWGSVYGTTDAIVDAFSDIYSDDLRLRQISGCADETMEHFMNRVDFETQPPEYIPRIIDTVIINDELDLLRLRLEYLRDKVDAHIIVESDLTFTGKPKRLHFNESKFAFQEFNDRIIHIILKDFPHKTVTATWQVWANEYFSRNAVANGFRALSLKDEDIIVRHDYLPENHTSANFYCIFFFFKSY